MIDELIRKHEGLVTRLTLNRRSKTNALSKPMVEALIDAVEYARTDGTRLLILDAARVGTDKAREILSASRPFDAEEALRIAFLTRIAPQSEWEAITASARAHCEVLSRAAATALHAHTLIDTRAEDMAALARSVSTPGLKERIRIFREEQNKSSHLVKDVE